MKYFKLVWLIMSGRLRLESSIHPEKPGELTTAGEAERAFARIN
jgi:hypothetical protein